ncbi:twin-arginine translocase subunit TatC [Streptomyces sp. NPDC001817]|uniref:twin-arginine translocase subunit TatC n=1 Tax=Streptomyces sp. NPDC001817 TaxID=3154398 RepID=UPI00332EF112
MPLAEHLRELRNRLLVSMLALAIATVVGWLFHGWLLDQLTGPACHITHVHGVGRPTKQCPDGLLVNTGLLSPLSLSFKVSITAGLILASPVWSYQLWAFIAPGLYKKEKRYGLGFTFAAVPLFCGGGYLAYVIFPKAVQILASFNPADFSLSLPGDEFLGFFLRMVFVFGLSFELPLLLVLLNSLGVVSAARLRSWWRPTVFVIFVFSAVVIPTGDPLTMTALAVPLCLLYSLALAVATLHDRTKKRRRAEDPDSQLDDDEASSPDLTTTPLDFPEPVDVSHPAHAQPTVTAQLNLPPHVPDHRPPEEQ